MIRFGLGGILLITKAIIQSVNPAANRCIVRMPLFETASNPNPVEAEALVNVPGGIFNNLTAGDIVFVAFEENALDKPIVLGKLFRGADIENNIRGGGAVLNTLKVRANATIPSSTLYSFPKEVRSAYEQLNTPKKTADYIKWLESLVKQLASQLDNNFRCFKNWTQWQLQAENVEIDDGDLDKKVPPSAALYQCEGGTCEVCSAINCTKNNKRNYAQISTDKNYPNL